jgi:WXG100 family type VII secretion target
MGFRVTPEQLDDLGNSYSQQASAIQGAHDVLQQRSNAIESSWTGAAAQEHQMLMQQYNAELAKMEETLNQIAANLHTAANNYREADASAQKGFTA